MIKTPNGMSRRHFMRHMAASSAMAPAALSLADTLRANEETMRKNHKAAIILWMGGGPSAMDIWDLKPGAPTGGEFRPIATTGQMQISEHMPMMAQQMHNMAIVRSMSTREADHGRGRYYMHTGYVPNPNLTHPSYGSVLAHEVGNQVPDLEIPSFVSIGGGSEGPGFLGMRYAPFVVGSNGQVRNLNLGVERDRLMQRMQTLSVIEKGFINERRGSAAKDHAEILDKTLALMTSKQMDAFKYQQEPQEVQERYGMTGFGRGCLMARRLVETGCSCVEVNLGGWDNHANIFATLRDNKLPELDRGMSALVEDLDQRGMLKDTVVLWMGEFSRTPRINAGGGRDHWARSWSVAVGGGSINGGQAVGETNSDGTAVTSEPYTSEDLMASVCNALGISLNTTFTSNNGRPMKIANSGKLIRELFS